jgi:uncharacterized membrane protein (GlpM family)
VSRTAVEWVLKTLAGGSLVVVFAVIAQMMTPKRLAGVLAAAPSVALGSLAVTIAAKGPAEATSAAHGMVAGAVAFTVSCLVLVPALRRWGVWRATGAALAAWAVVATLVLPVVPRR